MEATAKSLTILILEPDDYAPDALAAYRALGRVLLWPEMNAGQRNRALAGADILVVRLVYRITNPWLSRMPNLKIIATPTTGLTHIDTDAAKKRGIKIISLGGSAVLGRIPSTAEETMGLLLGLVRKIPWAFEDVKRGRWNRDEWKGRQLYGKTVGILGFGRLGRMVARYGRAFGMRVIAADPYVSKSAMARRGVAKVSMEALFKNVDIVSIHVSLGDDTRDLVRKKHIRMMKPTAYLINTARAEIIERHALIEALREEWIAGAAIDVMRDEDGMGRHLKRDPLWGYAKTHHNLLIVPHLGGATTEAMRETEAWIAARVVREARHLIQQ